MTESIRIRPGTRLAYAISALTTLLWFACVLPAGPLADGAALSEDLATPMYRAGWLLVPALLVLVIGPVGIVLSQGRVGRLAVLAATDAFVAGYAGIAMLGRVDFAGIVTQFRERTFATWTFVEAGLVVLMLLLSALSAIELARLLRRGIEHRVPPILRGLRLAICLFVLLIPSWLLFGQGHDLVALLVPFVVVGASAAGPAFVKAPLGLRLTASIVHALLALYVVLVLRATIFGPWPPLAEVHAIGWTTLGLAGGILLLALVQIARIGLRQRVLYRRAAVVAG